MKNRIVTDAVDMIYPKFRVVRDPARLETTYHALVVSVAEQEDHSLKHEIVHLCVTFTCDERHSEELAREAIERRFKS